MSLHTRPVRESMGLRLIDELVALDPEKAKQQREAELESCRYEIRRAIEEYRRIQAESLPTHKKVTLEVSRNDPRYLAVANTIQSIFLQDAYILYPADRQLVESPWIELVKNNKTPGS